MGTPIGPISSVVGYQKLVPSNNLYFLLSVHRFSTKVYSYVDEDEDNDDENYGGDLATMIKMMFMPMMMLMMMKVVRKKLAERTRDRYLYMFTHFEVLHSISFQRTV